ncbi:MAG: universal stress protein [Pseudolabrys sp.]
MTQSLINTGGCVLGAVDASAYAQSVSSLGGWAARRIGAPLELLHTLDRTSGSGTADLSGSLSLGASDQLLQELADLDARRAKLAQAHGRTLLEQLRAQVLERHGVQADVRQRHGELVETLLDLEPRVRLFVIGQRGEHAEGAFGHLGGNLERVIRAVHRPVLVASKDVLPIQRFLIAYDGSATTRKCIEMVCASPLLRGLDCNVLMVGAEDAARRQHLDWALAELQRAGFTAKSNIVEGTADTVIPRHIERSNTDLLVMGAYGHSRIRHLIVGSTTTHVLRSSLIPVLLLR